MSGPTTSSLAALLLLLATQPVAANAQCVVTGIAARATVDVDRGDARAIALHVQETELSVTVPPSGPMPVVVRGALAFSGTTTSSVLALRAGAYASGRLEVSDDARVAITRARLDAAGVRADLEIAGVGLARDLVVPCEALTVLAPARDAARRSANTTPVARVASARRALVLRSSPQARDGLRVERLRRWDAPYEILERAGGWVRVRASARHSTLAGWVRAADVGPPARPPRGVVDRVRVRCGRGDGPGHALVLPGTPVSWAGARWATVAGNTSFLVDVVEDEARILAAPRVQPALDRHGCPPNLVLGTVPARAVQTGVVSHPELRMRRVEGRGLLVEHRSGRVREDLVPGDVIVALDGAPTRGSATYEVAWVLLRETSAHSLSVVRDGTRLELPRLEEPRRGTGSSRARLEMDLAE